MMYAKNSVRLAITITLILTILFNIDKPGRTTGTLIQPLSGTNIKKELPNSRSFAHEQRRARVSEAYGKLPIRFEANNSQTADQVKFFSRGSGYNLFLTPEEAVLSLNKSRSKTKNRAEDGSVIRMKFAGANPDPQIEGLGAFSGKTSYLIGNDPSKWRRNVVNYEKIRYRNLYPGTDLVYYGNQQQIEYDFIVAPGADPANIRLDFDGVSGISVDEGGDLVLNAGNSEVRQHKAVVYQEVEGHRQEIASRYKLKEGGAVIFEIGAYDRSRPLVIDPVLCYSTFLGGYDYESVNSIAVDEAGNIYITGGTSSLDFPTKDSLQAEYGGHGDAFVIKLNPEGSNLIFSTYLGGNYDDRGNDIKLDAEGNIFLIGGTYSNDFPTVNAIQPTYAGFQDAFVAKLANDGSALIFSTYLGGTDGGTAIGGTDYGVSLELDGCGDICLTGRTSSINFPTVNAIQPVHAPGTYRDRFRDPIFPSYYFNDDVFVAKLKGDGSALVFSTYLGGTANDSGQGLAVDGNGDIYVTGNTNSIDFPTANPLQPANGGSSDAFIVKFDGNGSVIYSTYFGGSSIDYGAAVSLDGGGNVYLLGTTYSSDFPTVSPLYSTRSGGSDLFVAKLNRDGSTIINSTYLGGTGDESARDLKVDAQGNAYITGSTLSNDFPTVNAIQTVLNLGNPCSFRQYSLPPDAILVKLDASSSCLAYTTYIGGVCGEEVGAIAIDSSGSAYVVGSTESVDFPITPGAFQNSFSDPNNYSADGFILKIVD